MARSKQVFQKCDEYKNCYIFYLDKWYINGWAQRTTMNPIRSAGKKQKFRIVTKMIKSMIQNKI